MSEYTEVEQPFLDQLSNLGWTSINQGSDIPLYKSTDGNIKVDVQLEDETVWLTQAQMAQLFDKGRSTITEHIANIFIEGELDEKVVCRNFRLTTQHGAIEGKTQAKEVKHYNLDVVISVGYRVKSKQGTQFRIWATQRLKEYIIKGFALLAVNKKIINDYSSPLTSRTKSHHHQSQKTTLPMRPTGNPNH